MTDEKPAALTAAQQAVILALLDTRTVLGASKATGIARSTIYSWLTDNIAFREEVRRARNKVYEEGLDILNSAFAKAVKKLEDALDHGAAGIRLKAALGIAKLGMEFRASHQFEEKMQELEDRARLLGRLGQVKRP